MSRPPRAEKPSRKIVYVRMSPDEIKRLDQRKPGGMSRSEFLRRRGLGWRTDRVSGLEAQAVTQLGATANNLNQLARALNTLRREGRASIGESEIEGLREQLSDLEQIVDQLRQRILHVGDDSGDDSQAAAAGGDDAEAVRQDAEQYMTEHQQTFERLVDHDRGDGDADRES